MYLLRTYHMPHACLLKQINWACNCLHEAYSPAGGQTLSNHPLTITLGMHVAVPLGNFDLAL
jgi:hypothetical protein